MSKKDRDRLREWALQCQRNEDGSFECENCGMEYESREVSLTTWGILCHGCESSCLDTWDMREEQPETDKDRGDDY